MAKNHSPALISRIWHGCTNPANTDTYESLAN